MVVGVGWMECCLGIVVELSHRMVHPVEAGVFVVFVVFAIGEVVTIAVAELGIDEEGHG